jgi:hypothetical protein
MARRLRLCIVLRWDGSCAGDDRWISPTVLGMSQKVLGTRSGFRVRPLTHAGQRRKVSLVRKPTASRKRRGPGFRVGDPVSDRWVRKVSPDRRSLQGRPTRPGAIAPDLSAARSRGAWAARPSGYSGPLRVPGLCISFAVRSHCVTKPSLLRHALVHCMCTSDGAVRSRGVECSSSFPGWS